VLFANRKLHPSFPAVSKSVTLNDLSDYFRTPIDVYFSRNSWVTAYSRLKTTPAIIFQFL